MVKSIPGRKVARGCLLFCLGQLGGTEMAMDNFNQRVIDEFRANEGRVGGPFQGAPVLLLHTTGAKSGLERVNPLMYLSDGDRILVFASKGGFPTSPDWYHNLKANSNASVAVGTQQYQVQAEGIV